MAAACLWLLAIAGCGGSGGETSLGSGSSATLSWNPPVENSDGSPLAASELESYRIYIGSDQTNLDDFIEIDASNHFDSYTVEYSNAVISGVAGTYYLAMTAINTDGIESALSEIISLTVN
jgi:fibronectin type 3 domain-containing protein